MAGSSGSRSNSRGDELAGEPPLIVIPPPREMQQQQAFLQSPVPMRLGNLGEKQAE